jgi:hypothetical protein
MLEKQKDIDAVVVATPTTPTPSSHGRHESRQHVYVQKPMTWSVHEARALTEAPASTRWHPRWATWATPATACAGLRVDLVRRDRAVREIHVWTQTGRLAAGEEMDRPKDKPAKADTLDWDLWLGPAPERPYNPHLLPSIWRLGATSAPARSATWVATCDAPFWAMKLKYRSASRAATSTSGRACLTRPASA